jgi:hypothetical protein
MLKAIMMLNKDEQSVRKSKVTNIASNIGLKEDKPGRKEGVI